MVDLITDSTAQSISGAKTFASTKLLATDILTNAGAATLTLPTTTDTLVGKATSDVLTSKELTSPLITEVSTPSTPASGKGVIFVDSADSKLKFINDGGTSYDLTEGTVTASSTTTFTNKTLTSNTNVLGGITMTLGSDAAMDIYYRDSGGLLTRLPAGTAGNLLSTNGTGTAPSWITPPSGTSKWTDAGTFTYLTATGDNVVIGQSTQFTSPSSLQVTGTISAVGGFYARDTTGSVTASAGLGATNGGYGYLSVLPKTVSATDLSPASNVVTLASFGFTNSTSPSFNFTSAQSQNVASVFIGPTTITGTSVQTIPTAASLYIENAPTSGTNTTITNKYAVWVDNGNTRLDGSILLGSSGLDLSEKLNMTLNSSPGAGSASTRVLGIKQNATTCTFTGNQTGVVYVNSIEQATLADDTVGGAIPAATTLYIAGEPLAGTNTTITTAYSLQVETGTSRFGGNVTIAATLTPNAISMNGNITLGSGHNLILNTASGTKIGTATNQKIGFWNATPVVREATAFTQTYSTATFTHASRTAATLTDNTAGTANDTLEAIVGTVYTSDVGAIRNNFADLASACNELKADADNTAQVLNQLIDTLQSYGLIA